MVTALTACRLRRLSDHTNSKRKAEHGGAAIEFALTLPILLAVMFGIIEFGLVLFFQEILTNAAREGARAAIIMTPNRNGTTVQNMATNVSTAYLQNTGWATSSFTVAVEGPAVTGGTAGQSGQTLIVRITRQYNFIVLGIINGLPFINANLPANITLSAATTMILE